MGKKLIIFYWAGTELLFIKKIMAYYEKSKLHTVSHHESWLGDNRSYVAEMWTLVKTVYLRVLRYSGSDFVLFGTNLCRMLAPFLIFKKKVVLIYNELPEMNNKLLGRYDAAIFKYYEKRIFVSSKSRMNLCNRYFNLEIGGFIPNVPEYNEGKMVPKVNEIVYAGLISESRFERGSIAKIEGQKLSVNFIGVLLDDVISKSSNIKYHGLMEQGKSQEFQKKFRYALLSYSIGDLNNDYCAPIKIYEYIMSNCVCISINNNKGLKGYIKKYPNLFVLMDDLDKYLFDQDLFDKEKAEFIKLEIHLIDENLKKISDLLQ